MKKLLLRKLIRLLDALMRDLEAAEIQLSSKININSTFRKPYVCKKTRWCTLTLIILFVSCFCAFPMLGHQDLYLKIAGSEYKY